MNVYYADSFVLPLPAGHRFPIEKYARVRTVLEEQAPPSLINLCVPPAARDQELCLVHTPAYVAAITNGTLEPAAQRRIGLPWSPGLVERSRRSVGATMAAAHSALHAGLSASLAGGTHHAFADRGEGFCVFNDVAVAIRTLQAGSLVQRAAVIDLDVHQGDGTAAIFAHEESVFTLSVHAANNFPFRKETSDLDLPLPDGAADAPFLEAVHRGLRAVLQHGPGLAFYIAGADPFEGDRLGRLRVSKAGLAERDRMVFAACADHGVPVVIVMGGGYASNIEDTVDIHVATVLEAARRSGSASRISR